MSLIKLTSEGSWWVKSESDPRWNNSGTCLVGSFTMPEPVRMWIELQGLKLGPKPIDLEWGYHKY